MRLFIAAAVFAILASACFGDKPTPTPPPLATAETPTAPEPTESSTTSAPENTIRWKLGAPIELGSGLDQLNLELYIEQGCTQCDGPPTTLERIFRDPSGALGREVIFRRPEGSTYLTSTAMSGDGTLYTTACFGQCAEVGSHVGNGSTIIYTSIDGGANWTASAPTPTARRFNGTTLPDGQLILYQRAAVAEGELPKNPTFSLIPSGEELVPPFPDAYPLETGAAAFPILWQRYGNSTAADDAKLYRANGSVFEVPQMGGAAPDETARLSGAQRDGVLTFTWFQRVGTQGGEQHIGMVRGGVFEREFIAGPDVGAVIVQAWIDDHRALVWMNYSESALVDFQTAEVRPIQLYDSVPTDTHFGRKKVIGYRAPD